MARKITIPSDMFEPVRPPTFDERMQEGRDIESGIAGSMKFDTPSKPFYRAQHKPTRCEHDEDY